MELSFSNGQCEIYELPEEKTVEFLEDQYFITFGTEAFLFDYVYAKGSVKILFYLDNEAKAFPMALSSFIETGVAVKGLKVGWRHFCTHPMAPWFGENTFLKFYDEVGDELFIRYETGKIAL